MFDRRKLSLDGAQAQALVLEKTVYAAGVETGRAERLPVLVADEVRGRLDHRGLLSRVRS
jgi:hypothetical protein